MIRVITKGESPQGVWFLRDPALFPLQMESLSPCGLEQRLSPLQQPPPGAVGGRGPSPYQHPPHPHPMGGGGDIFSFNLPVSSHGLASPQAPPMQGNPAQLQGGVAMGGPPNSTGPHPHAAGLQLFGNT